MAAATLLPDGIGAYDSWGLAGAATKMLAVAADDGDTSYIVGGNGIRQRFTFADCPSNADSPLLTAVVKTTARELGNPTQDQFLLYDGSAEIQKVLTASYAEYSTNFYSLVVAAVNAGQIGVFSIGGTSAPRVTFLRLDITYTVTSPAGGGFGFFFGFLLPLLGAGLSLADMERAVVGRQFREPHRIHRLSKSDVPGLYLDWRSWRRPSTFDLGGPRGA